MEDETRSLIFEGDLLEINPDNYSAVQRKRGYLFNDGIMLAVWVTNRFVDKISSKYCNSYYLLLLVSSQFIK